MGSNPTPSAIDLSLVGRPFDIPASTLVDQFRVALPSAPTILVELNVPGNIEMRKNLAPVT